MFYSDETTKGIVLLILGVAGNFMAETLGCNTQKLLSTNMFAKHAITLLILFFAIDFTSGEPKPPHVTLKLTFVIYILFLLFTKMNMQITIAIFILIISTYVVTLYLDYYNNYDKKERNTSMINNLEYVRKILYIIITVLIVIGFVLYLIKQRKEHAKDWSSIDFLFGKLKCK